MAKRKLKVEKARYVGAFDASGKEDQRCLVVAGFISSSQDWQSFHTQWTERLNAEGLTHFHMVDFAASRGEFAAGWKDDEQRAGQIELSRAYPVYALAQLPELLRGKKEFALGAYSLAGRTCVADMANWKQRENLLHVPTGFVFEEDDEGAGELSTRLLEDGHSRPVFLPKKDRVNPDGNPVNAYTPLQAADMFAYELAKPFRDLLNGKPRVSSFRWAFEEFNRIHGETGYYSPKNLIELNEKLESLRLNRSDGREPTEPEHGSAHV